MPLSKRVSNKAKDVRHHVGVRLGGTRQAEREWRIKGPDSTYWESRNHPHRNLLADKISSFQPISILEIGCNTGPNLYRLALRLPEARLVGIDVSKAAIDQGKKLFSEADMHTVELEVGRAGSLDGFQDESFDVVFTDAVLIYIGADNIQAVAREMVRLARKAIVLVEFNDPGSGPRGTFIYKKGYWKRDYEGLFRESKRVKEVRSMKITEDIWPDEYWAKYGSIIEAIL